MRKMQIIVERKCLTEDSEVKVYLSLVQEKQWSQIKKVCKTIIFTLARLVAAAVIIIPFGLWFIQYAYFERGYKAYGGEYLLIICGFYIFFKVLGVLLKD